MSQRSFRSHSSSPHASRLPSTDSFNSEESSNVSAATESRGRATRRKVPSGPSTPMSRPNRFNLPNRLPRPNESRSSDPGQCYAANCEFREKLRKQTILLREQEDELRAAKARIMDLKMQVEAKKQAMSGPISKQNGTTAVQNIRSNEAQSQRDEIKRMRMDLDERKWRENRDAKEKAQKDKMEAKSQQRRDKMEAEAQQRRDKMEAEAKARRDKMGDRKDRRDNKLAREQLITPEERLAKREHRQEQAKMAADIAGNTGKVVMGVAAERKSRR